MRENLEISDTLLDELATAKLEMVGLSPADGKKFPAELSGGMTKRAALARALRPSIPRLSSWMNLRPDSTRSRPAI